MTTTQSIPVSRGGSKVIHRGSPNNRTDGSPFVFDTACSKYAETPRPGAEVTCKTCLKSVAR